MIAVVATTTGNQTEDQPDSEDHQIMRNRYTSDNQCTLQAFIERYTSATQAKVANKSRWLSHNRQAIIAHPALDNK